MNKINELKSKDLDYNKLKKSIKNPYKNYKIDSQ